MSPNMKRRTTTTKTDSYDVVMPLLKAMYEELKAFSKKKPDGAVGKNKILIINRILEECRSVLKSEASLKFLDLLDEADFPQNSDVTLILSQYVVAMEQFKDTYYVYDEFLGGWTWVIED